MKYHLLQLAQGLIVGESISAKEVVKRAEEYERYVFGKV